MNRTLWIAGRYSLVFASLLLLQACATAPRRGITLEAARESLQTEFPELLRSFDLHLGTFSVDATTWDSLSPASRADFVMRCSETRQEVAKQCGVRAEADGRLLVMFDGATTVYYGGPPISDPRDDAHVSGQGRGAASGADLLLLMPRPVYPARALQAGVEGTVVIQACVAADGTVQALLVVDGGVDMLNAAALDAVRKARFRPFDSGIGTESAWVEIPLRFSIRGERPSDARASHGEVGTSLDAIGSAELESVAGYSGK